MRCVCGCGYELVALACRVYVCVVLRWPARLVQVQLRHADAAVHSTLAMLTLNLVVARAHGCSSSRVRAHTHQHAYFPKNMRHRNYQVVAWLRVAPHGPRMVNDGRPAQATAVAGPHTYTPATAHAPHPHRIPHPHRDRCRSAKKFLDRDAR